MNLTTFFKYILIICFPIFCHAQSRVSLNDTVINKRLQMVEKTIKLPYSNVVLEQIKQKIYPNISHLNQSLTVYKHYELYIETELLKQNLPIELKYLPYAISEMNNRMTGKFGTAGIWGLTISVAVKYGLTVTPNIDERFNVEKSTKVAIMYLKDLYDIYSDWWKTIIAFTNSPAGLNAAIIRLKDSNFTIWDIYHKSRLPFSDIIPNYIYSTYIVNYMETYDVRIKTFTLPDCIYINLKNDILVNDLIDKIGMTDSIFFLLNPIFVSNRISKNPHYPIAIPANKEKIFRQWEDSLYTWAIQQKSIIFIPDSLDEIEDDSINTNSTFIDSTSTEIEEKPIEKPIEKPQIKTPDKSSRKQYIYIVKKGDVLSKIADKHHVSTAQIRDWNNLKNDNINIGQKLIIKATNDDIKNPDKVDKSSSKSEHYIYYTVKKGDTLWSIASKYNVEYEDIKKQNNIGNSIHPGQVIKITKK